MINQLRFSWIALKLLAMVWFLRFVWQFDPRPWAREWAGNALLELRDALEKLRDKVEEKLRDKVDEVEDEDRVSE